MGRLGSAGSVGFSCPKCCRPFARRVEAIEHDPNVHCPHCGALFDHHELEQLRRQLRDEIIRHKLRYRNG